MSLQVQQAYYDFGWRLRQFVLYIVIAFGILIISGIMFVIRSNAAPRRIMGAITIILSMVIVLLIYGFISYCRILGALRTAAEVSGDPQLQKASRCVFNALYCQFAGIVLFLIAILSLFVFSKGNRPILMSGMAMNWMGGIMLIIALIIIILGIIPAVLIIMALFALHDWSKNLVNQLQNYNGFELEQGLNLMKWGYVVGMFIPGAQLLVLIGMYKASTGLTTQFNPNPAPVPGKQYKSLPGLYVSPQDRPRYCPNCGRRLVEIDSNFCSQCGQKL